MLKNLRWTLCNITVERQRPVFTQGRGGNQIENPASIDVQNIKGRIQEKKLKSIGHVGEEIKLEGLINRRLYIFDCNFTVNENSKVATDIQLADRVIFTITGIGQIKGRITSIHDAAGAGVYLTSTIEWESPTGDN